MDVINNNCINTPIESTEIIRTISDLCGKLLNIYKTEFFVNHSPLEFLNIIPGFDVLLEVSLVISNKLLESKYKERFNKIYQDVWQDYQEHQQLYGSFKKNWLKILDIIEISDPRKKQSVVYYFNNLVDFLQQQNLLCTNFELMNTTINTLGNNLLIAVRNFLTDLVFNGGYFNIKNNDLTAFKLGKNLAVTPGKIIYQNDLIELIQYSVTVDHIYKIPILIIPPCINKYYVLDLSPSNSLVKWLVEHGFLVYMISWNNPNKEHADREFSDYIIDGALTAINVINNITACDKIHTVGYCIGGTILSCLLSYIEQQKGHNILSATNFMSLLDFSNIGDISMFVNESSLGFLENVMNKKGYLDGRILSMAFNALRPNDLIWPYFINNYLLNKPLQAFDILYWNSDPTNLPANMYKFYLRDICYKNLLCKPNAIEIKGVGIDLSKVTVPMFSVAGEKDHITPWKSVYSSARLYGGSSQFILSSSGHVKGLINPPKDNKYSYKISIFNKKLPKNPAVWLDRSIEYPGSWWNYWKNWLISINSEKIKSKECAALNINSLRDAPGSYVLKRL